MEFLTLNDAQYQIYGDRVEITAKGKTDLIISPIDGTCVSNAPFLYRETSGDFVLRAKVTHQFASSYDACALLAYQDDRHWAKACFEASDFNTHAVVSVMTNGGVSDDANGVDLPGKSVWLQLCRKANTFAVHYSLDGGRYTLARICGMPLGRTLKVGLCAQNPLGGGAAFQFEHYSLESRALADIRNGNI